MRGGKGPSGLILSNVAVVEPLVENNARRRCNCTPVKVIAKTIERYKKGERVVALAKELGVSEAAVYLWIKADKAKELERVKRAGITLQNAVKADKRDLALE